MLFGLPVCMPREPAAIAKWLLIVFAAGALVFLGVPVVKALQHGADYEVLMTFTFVPWIVGPAGLAALLAAWSSSRVKAWSFLVAEVAAVTSSAWLWTMLVIRESDPHNSVAMMFFPFVQFAVLLAYTVGALSITLFLRRKRSAGDEGIGQP